MINNLLSGPLAPMFQPIFLNALRLVQDGMIFKPTKPEVGNIRPIKSPKDYTSYKLSSIDEIDIKTADGETLLGWYKKPESGRPTFLYLPGNTGHFGDCGCGLAPDGSIIEEGREYRLEAIEKMIEDGNGFLSFCYRGFGKSTGKPSEQGLQIDTDAAYKFLLSQGIAREDIIFYGDSLGGAVAIKFLASLDTAARPNILVTTGTFLSMADKGHDLYPQIPIEKFIPYLRHPYESSTSIKKLVGMKLVIIHGTNDETTYPYHAEKLANTAKSSGIDTTLIMVDGAGHIDIDPTLIVSAAIDAYKEASPK